jgi:tRNA-specific 2-thiouridylase
MSGGVDSSVSCALLKNMGYAVSAAFLLFWDVEEKIKKALSDARIVCESLNIPLTVIDARADFKKTVIEYFLAEYVCGKTPNPCVHCNAQLKFRLLLEMAKKMEIDLVATGHYARLKNVKAGNRISYELLPGNDGKKDQSYFLYRLGQKELARIIFPLGEYQKADVRKLAEKFGLPVFDKIDSQDVCFMADNNLERFLAKNINLKKGKIIDTEGQLLGKHRGLPLYTIGQRKGIEIGGTGPYFVVAKDMKKNNLIVANDLKHLAIARKAIKLLDVVWTRGITPKFPLAVLARTRYHNPLVCAIVKSDKGEKTCQVKFDVPQKAISPGQSVVFYGKDGEVLGGGVIT